MMSEAIQENVRRIREEIAQAAQPAGRDPKQIKILAATKTRNIALILAAAEGGVDLIGENTVQEALSKFEFLPSSLGKHMIGTLQPNKVKAALRLFDLIESVQSLELARIIDHEADKLKRKYPVLIEVNPAGEASKQGVELGSIEALADEICKLEHIQLRGLMAMMPHAENPEDLRPLFCSMNGLFEKLRTIIGSEFDILSMGMSNDYKIAVEEGSTLVRLGSLIFGARGY
jgi:hypothetical protein